MKYLVFLLNDANFERWILEGLFDAVSEPMGEAGRRNRNYFQIWGGAGTIDQGECQGAAHIQEHNETFSNIFNMLKHSCVLKSKLFN